jgi:hypothetical protein
MHKHAKYGKTNKICTICNNILYMQQQKTKYAADEKEKKMQICKM